MRAALLAFPLLFTAAPSAAQLPKPCDATEPQRVDQRQPARIRKLSEMPPGTQMLAVLREVEGCYRPVVVRERVGSPPRR
jgi:hypothetical protein